jgi:urocanate hydratase
MVLDGSSEADRRISQCSCGCHNGIARRSWARNSGAIAAITREMERTPGLVVTMPEEADEIHIMRFSGNRQ